MIVSSIEIAKKNNRFFENGPEWNRPDGMGLKALKKNISKASITQVR